MSSCKKRCSKMAEDNESRGVEIAKGIRGFSTMMFA